MLQNSPGGNVPRCPRCAAPLTGPFCGRCGAAAGYPIQPYAPPPQYARAADWGAPRKNRTAVFVVVAILLAAAVCFAPIGILLHTLISPPAAPPFTGEYGYGDDYGYGDNYGDYFSFDDEYGDYYGYGDSYGYGFAENETQSLRLDVLSTSRVSAEEENPGYLTLTVEVCLTNIGYDIVNYTGKNFEVMSGYGKLIPPILAGGETALGTGRLLPEGQVRGFLHFLVPEEEYGTVLCYSDDSSGDFLLFPLM